MQMFFTIIIPTLNEEKFLPLLLSDLAKQRFTSFEVIVVDGSSKDNTKKRALEYEKKLSLTFLTVDKRNVSFQRNYGAGKANGSYLVFLDADCRILPTFLTHLEKEIKKSHYLLYIPAFYPKEKFFQDKLVFSSINRLIDFSQYTTKPYSIGGNMVFEKLYFTFVGGFDETAYLSEDHEIIQRAKKYGTSAKFLNKPHVLISMRRFRYEGYYTVVRKYLIALVHNLRWSKTDKKIFEYKMGGSHYGQTKAASQKMDKLILDYFKRIRKSIKKLS